VWQLAQSTPALYRAVVFYGVTPTNDDQLRTIQTPVLGHYAELDYLITARVLKTKRLLGNRFTYYVYVAPRATRHRDRLAEFAATPRSTPVALGIGRYGAVTTRTLMPNV